MNSIRRKRFSRCLLALGIALSGAGCAQQAPAGSNPPTKDTPLVRTAAPRQQMLTRTTEQPGHVEAFEQTPMYAKIPGFVEKVYVERGALVKKDAPLADLSVPELVEEGKYKSGLVEQAKIDITLAERLCDVAGANMKTSASLVEEAKFSLLRAEATLARWRSESLRMEELVRQKVIDVQSRDETLSQFESARAARDEADAKHKSAEAVLTESRARSNKAQTDVAAARNRLQLAIADERRVAALLTYTHITAPFDGVVSVRKVDTQHFVQPSSGPLFVVVRMDKVRVFVDVPETDAILIKYGSKNACVARIKVPALNDREFIGNVVGSSWALEPGQHTLRAEIDFDNPDGWLRPHMYVRALIDESLPDAWMIPASAVTTRDGLTFGFLLENGKAVKTPVKVGGREGNFIQLMKRQLPAPKPGAQPEWVDITGAEAFILDNVSELRDEQGVSAEVPTKNR